MVRRAEEEEEEGDDDQEMKEMTARNQRNRTGLRDHFTGGGGGDLGGSLGWLPLVCTG